MKNKLKVYNKKELAALYMPDSTVEAARKQLSMWIKYNKDLTRELEATGYSAKSRILTPKQVQLIYHYLGEPDIMD